MSVFVANVYIYMPLFQTFITIDKVNKFESPKGPRVEDLFIENPAFVLKTMA